MLTDAETWLSPGSSANILVRFEVCFQNCGYMKYRRKAIGGTKGEVEFPYKKCSPKIKDKTIKNRISDM